MKVTHTIGGPAPLSLPGVFRVLHNPDGGGDGTGNTNANGNNANGNSNGQTNNGDNSGGDGSGQGQDGKGTGSQSNNGDADPNANKNGDTNNGQQNDGQDGKQKGNKNGQDNKGENDGKTYTSADVDTIVETAVSRALARQKAQITAKTEREKREAQQAQLASEGKFQELYEGEKKRADELEAALAQRDAQDLKGRVASKFKLPDELKDLLQGDTEAELEESAKKLAKFVTKPGVNTEAGGTRRQDPQRKTDPAHAANTNWSFMQPGDVELPE